MKPLITSKHNITRYGILIFLTSAVSLASVVATSTIMQSAPASANPSLSVSGSQLLPPSPACIYTSSLPCQSPNPSQPTAPPMTALGSQGMNLAQAFRQYTTGSPNVVVAYIEGGMNWQMQGAQTISDHMYLNWHNLPVPCTGTTLSSATMVINGKTEACHLYYSNNIANYDIDHDGVVRADEWAHDPRVKDYNHNGYIDPEDLIKAFSIGPGHGPYPNNISGWNFFRNNNDPATADSAYDHSDYQMLEILRSCPNCSILPVKAGNESLDSTTNLAKAWMYAYYAGARVIVSVTADLGYSRLMRQTINFLYSKGVIMLEASNDFDSTDHQGGMYWQHVIPGNGAVPDNAGTAWTRSDLTSWGTHTMFVAPNRSSTSESTPTLGGALALLLSFGNEEYRNHVIPQPLTGPQAVQIMRETATPVTNPDLPWPGSPGHWNMQYGYGIPNIPAAMKVIAEGQIPPVPSISSPSWYSIQDPTVESSVPVTGTIQSPGNTAFSWTVQAATGPQPTPSQWFTIGTGNATGSYSGTLGTLPLSKIPISFWNAPFRQSTSKFVNSSEQYAVTLRVIVNDSNGSTGITRRAINVVHDPTWMKGFPLKMHSSIEGTPALVDLQGTGQLDLVFGTSDGYIHAINPVTGNELPGWPVHTLPVNIPLPVPGVAAAYQPIVTPVAVGSLYNNGHLSVVATTLEGYVYVFNARGQLERGWPKRTDRGVQPMPVPAPVLPHTREPVAAAFAAPVLADLQGNGQLDIVQAGMDGYIHAWQPNGTDVPGWPVHVTLPSSFQIHKGYLLENDMTLVGTPTIAHLSGPSSLDIVERSQFTQITGSGIQPLPYGTVFAYNSNGQLLKGWPVVLPGLLEDYGSAMGPVTEGTDSPVAASTTGNGTDQVAAGPVWTPTYLLGANGYSSTTYGSFGAAAASMLDVLNNPNSAAPGKLPPGSPVPFATSGAFGRFGGQLTYAQEMIGSSHITGAEEYPQSGLNITQYEVAYPANSSGVAKPLPGFPAPHQGWDFFGAPMFAGVTAGGHTSIIEGGDSGAIDAYMPGGSLAPGFPLFTGGWTLYSPSSGDLLSNGQLDIVATTREGYVMAWSTAGNPATNNQWWHWHHDEYNSGLYGLHTRPPGAPRSISWNEKSSSISFIAPGNRWYTGEVASYTVTFNGLKVPTGYPQGTATSTTITVKPQGQAGSIDSIIIPAGTQSVTVQAVNTYGLNGHPESINTPGASAPVSLVIPSPSPTPSPSQSPPPTPSPLPSSNSQPQATHMPAPTSVTAHTVAAGRDHSTGPTQPKTPARTKIQPDHKRTTYRALSTLRTQGSRSPNSGSPILWIVLGALAVLLLAISGGIFIKVRNSKVTE